MDYKKLLGTLVILVLVVTVFGCKKKEAPALTPEELAKPAKEVREKTVATEEVLARSESTMKIIDNIKCDLQGEKGLFSFKLYNPTEKTYTLEKVNMLDTAVNPLKVKVNGRVFDYKYCRDGAGDVASLTPGASRICTRDFVPGEVTVGEFIIRTGISALGTPAENRILVQSIDFTSELLFKCD